MFRNTALRDVLLGCLAVLAIMVIVGGIVWELHPTAESASQFGGMFGVVSAFFAGAGLIAVVVTLRVQNQAALEKDLNAEYRALIHQIPLDAWTSRPEGRTPAVEQQARNLDSEDESLRDAYRYFDLCNSQAVFFSQAKVSRKTWTTWRDGMTENLKRPWFLARFLKLKQLRGDSKHFGFLEEGLGMPEVLAPLQQASR